MITRSGTTQARAIGRNDRPFSMSIETPEFHNDSICSQTDPEAFFPEKGGSTREAKKMCLTCPAIDACLEWAIANDERFGIWGGHSERERRKIKKDRAAAAELVA